MRGTIREIKVSELLNYYENPRHAIGSDEEDTLKKLFTAVGNQYMLNLAEDIQKNGLLGNQQIVAVYSEDEQKYVVYEGNRRIAAIKMLLDPDSFGFLDRATIDRARRIAQEGGIPETVNCYITDEQEAFLIMERVHSGEDKGRGTKQWTPREKEAFIVRQGNKKSLSYLVSFYIKKYFDGFDITLVLPFTTIQRIFNNREVKSIIGLDVSDESSFTRERMQLIIDASQWIAAKADASGIAVTRLFNKARMIEDKLLPWLRDYMRNYADKADKKDDAEAKQDGTAGTAEAGDAENRDEGASTAADPEANGGTSASDQNDHGAAGSGTSNGSGSESAGSTGSAAAGAGSGGNRNLPYFFQGLQYGELNPNDADTHGVAAVCRELQLFSDRKLVAACPIAAASLVRAIIEQAIKYYSKKHYIQGQDKLIWEDIKNLTKLSKIIDKYKQNLHNYITDINMRQYFMALFGNYGDNIDPLNWVIHRPAEFQLDAVTLIELPRKGLLALINFFIT